MCDSSGLVVVMGMDGCKWQRREKNILFLFKYKNKFILLFLMHLIAYLL